MPEIIGEYIDRLCTVEMRGPGEHIPRGVLRTFYDAAVRAGDGKPLSYRAASLLKGACGRGDFFFVFCGAGVAPHLPYGETDGPLGGVAIAHALNAISGAIPVFISSDAHSGPIISVARTAGFQILDRNAATKRPRWAALTEIYDERNSESALASSLIDRYKPVAMISVECTGPNIDGIFCSILGFPAEGVPAYHNFFRLASERGIPTVGVGDGGNEIGCGLISETVREVRGIPIGGHDVATTIDTDVLVFAGVSNWGGYGIAAMLAFLAGDEAALHDDEKERRMLEAVVAAGAAEGAEASLNPNVDGIHKRVHVDLINTLHEMVRNSLTPITRDF